MIGIEDGTVDTVISTLTLCSVECQQTTLENIYAWLRPGGRYISKPQTPNFKTPTLSQTLHQNSAPNPEIAIHFHRDSILQSSRKLIVP